MFLGLWRSVHRATKEARMRAEKRRRCSLISKLYKVKLRVVARTIREYNSRLKLKVEAQGHAINTAWRVYITCHNMYRNFKLCASALGSRGLSKLYNLRKSQCRKTEERDPALFSVSDIESLMLQARKTIQEAEQAGQDILRCSLLIHEDRRSLKGFSPISRGDRRKLYAIVGDVIHLGREAHRLASRTDANIRSMEILLHRFHSFFDNATEEDYIRVLMSTLSARPMNPGISCGKTLGYLLHRAYREDQPLS